MILVRDSLTAQNFDFANMSPGTYYWRVRASTNSGQVSDWSDPGKFTIVRGASGNETPASDWKVESSAELFISSAEKQNRAQPFRISGARNLCDGRRFISNADLFRFFASQRRDQ